MPPEHHESLTPPDRRYVRLAVGSLVAAAMLFGSVAGYIYYNNEHQAVCGGSCDAGDPDDCPQSCACSNETLTCVPRK